MIRLWLSDWWSGFRFGDLAGELLVLFSALFCAVILFALFSKKSK
jgi:hypothetical protein